MMLRSYIQLIAYSGILLAVSAFASIAASFDCDLASNEVEITICDSSTLSELDTKLSLLYESLPKDEIFFPVLVEDQLVWLERRNRNFHESSNVLDLESLYEERVIFLSLYGDYVAKCEARRLLLSAVYDDLEDICPLDHPVDICRQSLMTEQRWRAGSALEVCRGQWELIQSLTLRALEEQLYEAFQPNASVTSLSEFEAYLQSRRDFLRNAPTVGNLTIAQNLSFSFGPSVDWFYYGYYRELTELYEAVKSSER
ncbi:hypothetical protein LSUCC1028_00435 [Rhodobacterales bacterium LSUCC1028]|nr:hypothetical protein [Rhodobacterales bacterium LSUCC1028]